MHLRICYCEPVDSNCMRIPEIFESALYPFASPYNYKCTILLKRICLSAYKKSYITLFYLLKGIAYGPSALGNQGVAYFSNGSCFYSKCLHIHRELVSPRLKCRNSRNPAHNWWISFINSIRLACGRKCVRMVSYRLISFTILRKGQRSFS